LEHWELVIKAHVVKGYFVRFLKGHPDLQKVHVVAGKLMELMDLAGSEHLPPMKEFVLENYSWPHSAAAVPFGWNLNSLTHLELWDVPIDRFMTTIPVSKLPQLRHFATNGHFEGSSPADVRSKWLCDFVNGLRNMEILEFRCQIGGLCVLAIAKHRSTLRKLQMGVFSEGENPRNERKNWLILQLYDPVIVRICPHLTDLTVDINPERYHVGLPLHQFWIDERSV